MSSPKLDKAISWLQSVERMIENDLARSRTGMLAERLANYAMKALKRLNHSFLGLNRTLGWTEKQRLV